MAWNEQAGLAERYELWTVHRAGYGDSADVSDREDFELDARLLAPEVPPNAHIVGHSSGAHAALYLAALVPERIASLTVIEPPAYHLSPATKHLRDAYAAHFALEPTDWVDWLKEFFAIAQTPAPPDQVLRALEHNARVWKGFATVPWEAGLPLDEVAAARARK